jgi:hypothetical protein
MEKIFNFPYNQVDSIKNFRADWFNMHISFSPLTLLAALCTGILGAYLAYRRARNPYIWFCIGFFFGILGAFFILFASSRKKKAVDPEATPAPEPTILGPSDKFWYYLDPNHAQIGPMSLEALNGAWKQGKISLTTYVWHEELPEWKPLQELITN